METIETQIARMYPTPNEGQSLPPFNSGANAIRTITIDLTNARDAVELKIGGNFLWLANSNNSAALATIAFSREQGSDGIPFRLGTAVKGVNFASVFITNTAQAGTTITLIYIVESHQSLEIVNAGTVVATVTISKSLTLTSTADVSLLAGVKTAILAANAARRSALITNLAAGAATIRVGDAANVAAGRGIPVLPGETITLDTAAAISAWNPGGLAQSVAVLEIVD